jgi:ketosteroid isomerase-like protein
VALARRATQSLQDLLDAFSEAVTWDNLSYGAGVPPGFATVVRGKDDVARMIRSWVATWQDFTFDVDEIIDAGETVVVVVHQTGSGRTSGLPAVHDYCQVWTWTGGRIVSVVAYRYRADALKAVGLEE